MLNYFLVANSTVDCSSPVMLNVEICGAKDETSKQPNDLAILTKFKIEIKINFVFIEKIN